MPCGAVQVATGAEVTITDEPIPQPLEYLQSFNPIVWPISCAMVSVKTEGKVKGMLELIVLVAELILVVLNISVTPLRAEPVMGSLDTGPYAKLMVGPDPILKTKIGALHINAVLPFQLFTAVVIGAPAPPTVKFRLLLKVTKTLAEGAQVVEMPSTGGGVQADEPGIEK